MTLQRKKRQATDWDKCFAKRVFGKGLISRRFKDILEVSNKETNNPINKWAKETDSHQRKGADRISICKGAQPRCH